MHIENAALAAQGEACLSCLYPKSGRLQQEAENVQGGLGYLAKLPSLQPSAA